MSELKNWGKHYKLNQLNIDNNILAYLHIRKHYSFKGDSLTAQYYMWYL